MSDEKRKIIWAPWRIEYIERAKEKSSSTRDTQKKGKESEKEDCFICSAWSGEDDELVVFKGKNALIIMNKYPYNSGHVMICPRTHTSELSSLSQEEKIEIFELMEKAIWALRKAIKPHGFNIGINLGRVAGAGLEEHIHVHVVPRWSGDTNFMITCGNAKVIVEDIKASMMKIKRYLEDFLETTEEKQ